jgi:uncharacterized protein YbjT (DUF2867 family)
MSTAKSLNVIITGTTGMVGEGVLMECLAHPLIKSVLVINRRPNGYTHPKLKEILHFNLFDLSPIESELSGYDACYFCAGVSSVGMKEPEYFNLTYTLTTNVAKTLLKLNPGMVFEYISGSATDSTEKGKIMWARVKGKTENDLVKMPFKAVYNFRPFYMHPTPGQRFEQKYYKYISWMYPLLKRIFPNQVSTLRDLALAMINASLYGFERHILEVKDIKALAAHA